MGLATVNTKLEALIFRFKQNFGGMAFFMYYKEEQALKLVTTQNILLLVFGRVWLFVEMAFMVFQVKLYYTCNNANN